MPVLALVHHRQHFEHRYLKVTRKINRFVGSLPRLKAFKAGFAQKTKW